MAASRAASLGPCVHAMGGCSVQIATLAVVHRQNVIWTLCHLPHSLAGALHACNGWTLSVKCDTGCCAQVERDLDILPPPTQPRWAPVCMHCVDAECKAQHWLLHTE
eukprot:1161230-Pelagomonas_calceolata.AAC.4